MAEESLVPVTERKRITMQTLTLAQETNPWEAQAARFDEAAKRLKLDEGIWKVLRYPSREIIVHIPVNMDDGSIEVFTGYRVQHSVARGPAKGGIRFAPDVTLAMQSNLAVMQTLQEEIGIIEKRLMERVKLHPDYALLNSVPGIGPILATTIMLETGTISRFAKVGKDRKSVV